MKRLLLLSLFLLPFTTFAAGPDVKGITRDWGFQGRLVNMTNLHCSVVFKFIQRYVHHATHLNILHIEIYLILVTTKTKLRLLHQVLQLLMVLMMMEKCLKEAGRPADFFVAPYANDNAARAANGGAYPPDLSLITKARGGGANYLYSLLIGYKEPPESIEVREGLHYNKYYSGNLIAMPQPLYQDGVEYADGTNATIEQMAADVTNF